MEVADDYREKDLPNVEDRVVVFGEFLLIFSTKR